MNDTQTTTEIRQWQPEINESLKGVFAGFDPTRIFIETDSGMVAINNSHWLDSVLRRMNVKPGNNLDLTYLGEIRLDSYYSLVTAYRILKANKPRKTRAK